MEEILKHNFEIFKERAEQAEKFQKEFYTKAFQEDKRTLSELENLKRGIKSIISHLQEEVETENWDFIYVENNNWQPKLIEKLNKAIASLQRSYEKVIDRIAVLKDKEEKNRTILPETGSFETHIRKRYTAYIHLINGSAELFEQDIIEAFEYITVNGFIKNLTELIRSTNGGVTEQSIADIRRTLQALSELPGKIGDLVNYQSTTFPDVFANAELLLYMDELPRPITTDVLFDSIQNDIARVKKEVDYLFHTKQLPEANNDTLPENKPTLAAYAIMHVYLAKYGGKPVTKQNKNILAKEYGYTSGDKLKQLYDKYKNDSQRLNLHTSNKKSDSEHLNRFGTISELLKSQNEQAFKEMMSDYNKLRNNYNKHY